MVHDPQKDDVEGTAEDEAKGEEMIYILIAIMLLLSPFALIWLFAIIGAVVEELFMAKK